MQLANFIKSINFVFKSSYGLFEIYILKIILINKLSSLT